jgi:hypothetical protein
MTFLTEGRLDQFNHIFQVVSNIPSYICSYSSKPAVTQTEGTFFASIHGKVEGESVMISRYNGRDDCDMR